MLLENLLRFEDGSTVTADDIRAMAQWLASKSSAREIAFRPARVLMQDFTGVPAVVDLAAMRDAMAALGGDTAKINPLVPVDLVIDHSVMVDASAAALVRDQCRARISAQQGALRVPALGRRAFDNFRVVPPGTGICHQVNLEYLAQTVWTKEEGGVTQAFPDTLVGTDSHTTMVNGLAVLGWGVGGIEAEAAMLGQPISMLIPEVIGFRLTGELREGVTATDLVLTVTQMLRKKGVVGKFVEYFGDGLGRAVARRPGDDGQHGARIWRDLRLLPARQRHDQLSASSGRDPHRVALVEAYAKAQGMWRDAGSADPVFTATLELDLSTVEPSLAGPRRPQDRVPLARAAEGFDDALADMRNMTSPAAKRRKMVSEGGGAVEPLERSGAVEGESLQHRRRPRRDRGDHVVHQHFEPERAHRRGPARAQGTRKGPEAEAVGEDLARARQPGRHRLSDQIRPADAISTRSASTSSAMAARPASAIPGRCPNRSRRPSRRTISSRRPFSPATAISRAASIRTCARTIWPRRRWWSPTPWRAR